MVGVQDEQDVQRLRRDRIDVVGLGRHGEHHVEQVRTVVEMVLRVHERLAEILLVGGCRDGRDLGDHAVRENLALARILVVGGVVVERRERADDAGEHGHRMGVVTEAVEEAPQRLVDHGVAADRGLELFQLALVRQLAVEDQVGHFDEGGVGCQLFDRVAAIQQHALVAVDVGDGALGGAGGGEPGVIGEQVHLVVDLANIGARRSERARHQRQLDFFSGFVVEQAVAVRHDRNLRQICRNRIAAVPQILSAGPSATGYRVQGDGRLSRASITSFTHTPPDGEPSKPWNYLPNHPTGAGVGAGGISV